MSCNDNNMQVLDKMEAIWVTNKADHFHCEEGINNMTAQQQYTSLKAAWTTLDT